MEAKSDKTQFFGVWLAVVLPVLYLVAVSLLALTSAGAAKPNPYAYVKAQAAYLCVAACFGTFAAFVNMSAVKKFAPYAAVLAAVLLALVLVPGVGLERNGSRRWLHLLIVDFQASDFAKIALVCGLAAYLQSAQRRMGSFFHAVFKPLAIVGIFCALIMAEPDFGTTALCGGVGFLMIFFAGAKIPHLCVPSLLGAGVFAAVLYRNPNRLQRILSFLDLEGTKADGSYQLWQGIVAFGSGGVSGVGLGQGRQHLSYLPEAHTDFILSIIAEELGLFCTLGVAAAFFTIFVFSASTLKKAPDMFQFLLAAGSLFMIVAQAVFNLCVVTGMMPTKGISLPFVSFGGSNLVAMSCFAGILVNCMRNWNKPEPIEASEL